VAAGTLVDVDVEQQGPRHGVGGIEAGLLPRLAHGGLPRCLASFEVTARLQPAAEPLVAMQQHPTGGILHDGRTGHVGGIGELVQWCRQPRHQRQGASQAACLNVVAGMVTGEVIEQLTRSHVRRSRPISATNSAGERRIPITKGPNSAYRTDASS
jgi:hypothetical protein